MDGTSDTVWQAERTFDCIASDGSKSLIRTAVGFPRQPRQVGNTEEWQCPCLFEFLEYSRVTQISGADALQALTCALAIMMERVRAIQESSGCTVTYEGLDDLMHGLPDITFSKSKYIKGEEVPEEV